MFYAWAHGTGLPEEAKDSQAGHDPALAVLGQGGLGAPRAETDTPPASEEPDGHPEWHQSAVTYEEIQTLPHPFQKQLRTHQESLSTLYN